LPPWVSTIFWVHISPRPVLPEPVETNIENNLVLLANCVARNKAIWFVLFFE
jgi:hypothetical protein